MGVMATYCQICGLPVQHDHYVPLAGMFGIYRGDADDECAPLVPFGPEHAWLKDAVAVRISDRQTAPVVEGEIHDGVVEVEDDDVFVMEGIDERAALHRACWDTAGRPEQWKQWEADAPAPIEPYREQLFDFARMIADGHGWMLIDPRSDSADGRRSRERIRALLGIVSA